MSRIPALLMWGLALSALPAMAQESAPPAATSEDISPQVDTTPAPEARDEIEPQVETTPPAATQPTQKFATVDRLELDSTAITGNRELPKVLYIVPWKKADIGDLIGRPANSLLDEVLTPVDREVFRRQTDYFTKLNGEAVPQAAPPPAEPGR
jgi:hypothetical protein